MVVVRCENMWSTSTGGRGNGRDGGRGDGRRGSRDDGRGGGRVPFSILCRKLGMFDWGYQSRNMISISIRISLYFLFFIFIS